MPQRTQSREKMFGLHSYSEMPSFSPNRVEDRCGHVSLGASLSLFPSRRKQGLSMKLLVPQRLHWIYFSCASRGNEARQNGNHEQQYNRGYKRREIGWTHSE